MQKKYKMKHIFLKKSSKKKRYAAGIIAGLMTASIRIHASLRPLFAGVGGTTAACCPDGLPHLAMSPAYVQSVHIKYERNAIKI